MIVCVYACTHIFIIFIRVYTDLDVTQQMGRVAWSTFQIF